jgi:serine/threonine protein kinase
VSTLRDLFARHGLSDYLEVFERAQMDVAQLIDVSDEALVDRFGMHRYEHRQRFRAMVDEVSRPPGPSSSLGVTRVTATGATFGGMTRVDAGSALPESLGSYRVLGLVGAGGMGTVVRARHVEEGWATRQGGDVAIKLVHAHLAADPTFRERFFAEADLGRRLRHASLVPTWDVVVDKQWLGTVMSFVEGTPLTGSVRAGGLPLEEVLTLLGPIGAVLDHLHEQGIVHRDVKPANIVVRKDGTPVLLDLGIAKDTREGESHTRAMTAMGTSAWMAPEQADAKHVDGAADRYAFGLMSYALLTGTMPWDAHTSEARIIARKFSGDLVPLSAARPGLPPHVHTAVTAMLSVNPSDRPATCRAFLAALAEGPTAPMPATAAPSSADVSRMPAPDVPSAPAAPPDSTTPPARRHGNIILGDVMQFASDTTVEVIKRQDGKVFRKNERFTRGQILDDPEGFLSALSAEEKMLFMRLPSDPQLYPSRVDFFTMTSEARKQAYRDGTESRPQGRAHAQAATPAHEAEAAAIDGRRSALGLARVKWKRPVSEDAVTAAEAELQSWEAWAQDVQHLRRSCEAAFGTVALTVRRPYDENDVVLLRTHLERQRAWKDRVDAVAHPTVTPPRYPWDDDVVHHYESAVADAIQRDARRRTMLRGGALGIPAALIVAWAAWSVQGDGAASPDASSTMPADGIATPPSNANTPGTTADAAASTTMSGASPAATAPPAPARGLPAPRTEAVAVASPTAAGQDTVDTAIRSFADVIREAVVTSGDGRTVGLDIVRTPEGCSLIALDAVRQHLAEKLREQGIPMRPAGAPIAGGWTVQIQASTLQDSLQLTGLLVDSSARRSRTLPTHNVTPPAGMPAARRTCAAPVRPRMGAGGLHAQLRLPSVQVCAGDNLAPTLEVSMPSRVEVWSVSADGSAFLLIPGMDERGARMGGEWSGARALPSGMATPSRAHGDEMLVAIAYPDGRPPSASPPPTFCRATSLRPQRLPPEAAIATLSWSVLTDPHRCPRAAAAAAALRDAEKAMDAAPACWP